jgi:hypothetical protein
MGSYSWVLEPLKPNQWKTLLPEQSGLFVRGEIRSMLPVKIENKTNLVVLRNHEKPLVFEVR